MSETRIQLNQISGLSSGQTLETHLTSLNSKVGIFGGQVENVTALSSLTPVLDQHVFVKSDNKWVRYNGSTWVDVTAASNGGGGGASAIDDLTDVTISSPSNGQVLLYNGTAWVNGTVSGGGGSGATNLDGLTDVAISSATSGQFIKYNGTSWVNTGISISDITNLQTTLDGKANSVHVHNISDITGLQTELDAKAESLVDLSDINVSSPLDGQILTYDSATSKWIAETPSASASSLDELTDVTINSAATGQVVVYDGSNWVNDTISISSVDSLQTTLDGKASSTHTHAVSDITGLQSELDTKAESMVDLSDVNASGVTNGQVLAYNSTTSTWTPITPDAGADYSADILTIQGDITAIETNIDNIESDVVDLQSDVNILKNQAGVLFDTFSENFNTADYIDYTQSSNINHITSEPDTYIRANRQYNVSVSANLQSDEASSVNVQYDAGKVKLASGEVNATFTSKLYDVQSTTKAIIQADISNFIDNRQNSSELTVVPPSGGVSVPSNIVNFSAIEDNEDNVWYVYQDANTMNLYGWALTSSGSVRMSHRVLFSPSLNSTYNELYGSLRFYSRMRLEKDRDGNIYVIAPFPATQTNADMYLIKINKINLNVTSLVMTASTGDYGVGSYYDSDRNTLHTVVSSVDTYLNVFNLNTSTPTKIVDDRPVFNVGMHNPHILYDNDLDEFAILTSGYNTSSAYIYRAYGYRYDNDNNFSALLSSTILDDNAKFGAGMLFAKYYSNYGYVLITAYGSTIHYFRVNSGFTSSTDAILISSTVTSRAFVTYEPMVGYADSNYAYLVYPKPNLANTSYENLYMSKIRLSDGSLNSEDCYYDREITRGYFDEMHPSINIIGGQMKVLYRKMNNATGSTLGSGSMALTTIGSSETKVKIEAQLENDNWYTIYDNYLTPITDNRGQTLTIGTTPKNKLRLKAMLQSPNVDEEKVKTPTVPSLGTGDTGTIQSDTIQFVRLKDSSNRSWNFYQNRTNGNLYGWATNSDGTSYINHAQIGNNGTGATSGTLPNYRTMNAVMDSSGNIWVVRNKVFYGSTSNTVIVERISNTAGANKTFTSTQVQEIVLSSTVSHITYISLFYDSTANKLHLICMPSSTSLNVTHRVYDCSQTGAQTGTTLSIGTIAGLAAGAKITTSYDSSARELGVFILRNATSSAISAYRLGLGGLPSYPVSVGQTNYVVSANSNGVGDAFFDSSAGLHKVVSVRSGGLTIDVFTLPISFTTQTLTTLDSETFTEPTILTNSSSSLVVKDNYAHFVYLDNVAARSLYYSKFKISSGSFLTSDNATLNQILTTATTSELYPSVRDEGDSVVVYYVLAGSTTNTSTPSRVEFGLNFSGSIISPVLNGYQIYIPNDSTGATTGTFVSKSIMNDKAIAKVTLTANQTLNGGAIQWYLSNSGGSVGSWQPVTLGTEYDFASIGGDLRAKAIMTIPEGTINANSPKIDDFSILTSNTVVQSDIVPLQINLNRTNFKLSAFQNAVRYSLKNMIVDTFSDNSGINTSNSTGYTFDNTNKLLKATVVGTPATVVFVTESLTVEPSRILISSETTDGSGSVTFQVSRDGGTTWSNVSNEILTNISSLGNGTQLIVKVTISGDATLNSIAYSWN